MRRGITIDYIEKILSEEGELTMAARGIIEGEAKGKALFAALTAKLLDSGRIDDLKRAAEDENYRDALMIELEIKTV